jgi:hypothetical protein
MTTLLTHKGKSKNQFPKDKKTNILCIISVYTLYHILAASPIA